MRSQFDDNGAGPDVTEVVAEVSDAFRRNLKRFGPILLILLLLGIAARGMYKVDPGARGVVRRFGQEYKHTEPGLHYRIPIIEEVNVVDVENIRRIEVGFRAEERVPHESLMLTGDENIVEVQMIVQYRIADPSRYLFRLRNGEDTLRATAEVALRSMVGRTNIDDVITTGREKVQTETRGWLQKLMSDYESGLEITDVKLQAVDAPDEVKDAFHAVTRAREEKEKLINEAKGYREDRLPKARGEARKKERAAEAYKEQRVLRANGDSAKFLSVYEEYRSAEEVTRKRLHLETMERIFERAGNKVFVDGEISKGALPVLPIGAQTIGPLTATGGGGR